MFICLTLVAAAAAAGCVSGLATATRAVATPTAGSEQGKPVPAGSTAAGKPGPDVAAPSATELIVVEHKASVAEAGCSLAFKGESTVIRVAARGAAQAPAGQGVDISFRLGEGPDAIAFDTMSTSAWSPTLGIPSAGQGRPLTRNEGDPDSTAWSGTFEASVDGHIPDLHGVVLVTRYIPGSPAFSLLAATEFDCVAPEEAHVAPAPAATSTATATARPSPTSTRVPTPSPVPTATRTPVLPPTPAPSPTPTPSPSPTPTPVPVSVGPDILLDTFPLPGYEAWPVEPLGEDGWRARFDADDVKLRGYYWFVIDIFPITTAGDQHVKARECGGAPGERVTEMPAPAVGDAVKGCVYEREGGIRTFNLFTATRNVGMTVQAATPDPSIANATVIENMASLAALQIAVINQTVPAGPVMAVTTGTSRFQFSAPAALPPAEAGKPYLPGGRPFSFCDPPATGPTTPCPPPGAGERNPSGGSQPYHFQYGTLGGFPPFGMGLGKDGQLTGTPHQSAAGRTYRFIVCAVDLKADFVCREVSITVSGAVATPTPTPLPPTPTRTAPTPTPIPPTATPTRTPTPGPAERASVTISSASCSLLRRFDKNGYDYGEWQVIASGTASGPAGTQVEMPNWLGYKNYTAEVGWTKVFGAFARRDQGQPFTTGYSIRFTIESTYNAGYGPSDRLGASISGPDAYTVFVDVVCPAP